jgi:hypothetical protein
MACTSSSEKSICGISLCLETLPSESSACSSRGLNRGVDVAHRRGFAERALANGFDGVAATAFFLKDEFAPCL